MVMTASRLRQDIYRVLDRVLETGVPVEILRNGKLLRIVPPEEKAKLERLAPHEYLRGDPEELVHLDWSAAWKP
jgi:antitoxin (DNA-binding transcriptional repressor) of toxin-antitoxin stability system